MTRAKKALLRLLAVIPTLGLAAAAAPAQSLFLSCKPTKFPDLDYAKIYRTNAPVTKDTFISDMMMQGLLGVLVNRASTWEIDVSKSTVSSPERNSGPVFSDAAITSTNVTATASMGSTGINADFSLNRINGALTYTIYLPEAQQKSWTQAHQGHLPSVWTWELACTSSAHPQIR